MAKAALSLSNTDNSSLAASASVPELKTDAISNPIEGIRGKDQKHYPIRDSFHSFNHILAAIVIPRTIPRTIPHLSFSVRNARCTFQTSILRNKIFLAVQTYP